MFNLMMLFSCLNSQPILTLILVSIKARRYDQHVTKNIFVVASNGMASFRTFLITTKKK